MRIVATIIFVFIVAMSNQAFAIPVTADTGQLLITFDNIQPACVSSCTSRVSSFIDFFNHEVDTTLQFHVFDPAGTLLSTSIVFGIGQIGLQGLGGGGGGPFSYPTGFGGKLGITVGSGLIDLLSARMSFMTNNPPSPDFPLITHSQTITFAQSVPLPTTFWPFAIGLAGLAIGLPALRFN